MKIRLIKPTLIALALGSFGLLTTPAYANHDRFEDDHGKYASHAPAAYGGRHARDAFQQSAEFIRRINARQDRQMERIFSGKRSGELTRHEFRDLMHEQREVRVMEQRFLADGFMDPREFRRLDRALDRAGRSIRMEKHDHQARNQRGSHGGWYN